MAKGVERDDGMGQEADAAGIQAIEFGLTLLRPILAAGGSATLKEIADATGVAPPKAHRYLVSLVRTGLLERDSTALRYRPGPLAVQLGFSAIGMLDRDGAGRATVLSLAATTGFTACLVVWANRGPTVVAVEPGQGAIFTGLRIGSQLPLLRSASGRVFLAHLPATATAPLLIEEGGQPADEDRALARALKQIREQGVSTIRDAVMPGMSGLSAPVLDHAGTLNCALTLLGQTALLDTSLKGSPATVLRAAAAKLSARLGYLERRA